MNKAPSFSPIGGVTVKLSLSLMMLVVSLQAASPKALPQRGSGEGADIEDDRLSDIEEFVVSHLSEREQRIFGLRFSEGYSYEEIAVAEGISKVAVWKHLSHAITEVKKHFNTKNV